MKICLCKYGYATELMVNHKWKGRQNIVYPATLRAPNNYWTLYVTKLFANIINTRLGNLYDLL